MASIFEKDPTYAVVKSYEMFPEIDKEVGNPSHFFLNLSLDVSKALPLSTEEIRKAYLFLQAQTEQKSLVRRTDFKSLNNLDNLNSWPDLSKGCLALQSKNMGCIFLIVKTAARSRIFNQAKSQFLVFLSSHNPSNFAFQECCTSLEIALEVIADIYEKAADLHYY